MKIKNSKLSAKKTKNLFSKFLKMFLKNFENFSKHTGRFFKKLFKRLFKNKRNIKTIEAFKTQKLSAQQSRRDDSTIALPFKVGRRELTFKTKPHSHPLPPPVAGGDNDAGLRPTAPLGSAQTPVDSSASLCPAPAGRKGRRSLDVVAHPFKGGNFNAGRIEKTMSSLEQSHALRTLLSRQHH